MVSFKKLTAAGMLLASILRHGQLNNRTQPKRRKLSKPPMNSARECARRRRQIAAGILKVSK